MVQFFKYLIVWISQNLAVPFWMVGHVHLSVNVYEDIYEIIASFGMNIIVAVGFIINYLEEKKVMKTEKRKVGRPRKQASADVVVMKMQSEIDLENAKRVIAERNEIIAGLETMLDEAYKEQEAMLKDIDKFIFNIIHHCAEVDSKAGKITLRDVDYSVNLLKRILEHKYLNGSTKNQ